DARPRLRSARAHQLAAGAGAPQALRPLGEPGAAAMVEEVLGQALAGSRGLLLVTLEELGPAAEARALRPPIAWRVAQRLDAGGDRGGARPHLQVARGSRP